MIGGETQQTSLNGNTGYSAKAQCTGKPAYLEPNRNSMQKPIGGLPEKIEGEVRIGAFHNQKNADSQQKEYANDS